MIATTLPSSSVGHARARYPGVGGLCNLPFIAGGGAGNPPRMPTPRLGPDVPSGAFELMDTQRRGNYDSGEDFVLEYGELRFTFNERDFAERCEQAARKLGFVGGRLEEPELEDLVNLAVNGEIHEPASAPGRARQRLLARARRPVRPLARPLAAAAGLPLGLARPAREGGRARRRASTTRSQSFAYVQPDRDGEPVELAPEPSWGRVAYSPR